MDNFFNLEVVTIQTFDDVKERRRTDLVCIFPYDVQRVKSLNAQGAGIFFVPNQQIELKKRSIENTTAFGYLSLDLDIAKEKDSISQPDIERKKQELSWKLKQLAIVPNLVMVTKHGLQPIWAFSNPMQLTTIEQRYEANEYYKKLVKGFEAKTNLHSEGDNLARVIRFPNTYHMKNPDDKFFITVITLNDKKSSIEDFANEYPPANVLGKRSITQILHNGSTEGRRNIDMVSVIGSLLDHYHKGDWENICWQLVQAVNATYIKPPLDINELQRTFNSIANTILRKDPEQKNSNVPIRIIKTVPISITFSREYKQKLIAREQHLLRQLQEIKVTDPKYPELHKEWFRLRIKGEELGLFFSVVPIENEPWKTNTL